METTEKKILGPRVLVVDDAENERRALVIGLRLEGFDAVGATGGSDALSQLEKSRFDVVLIDLMMPSMNGLQLARNIRLVAPTVITVLMSAYALSPIQLARADVGVVGFVPKPYCFEELVKFIRTKMELARDSRSPSAQSSLKKLGLPGPVDLTEISATG